VTSRNDSSAALTMVDAFASVGARVFDLTITDQKGDKVPGLQRPGRSLDEMRRRIGHDLQDGERNQHNVIVRPRSTTALLIQLDDFTAEKAAQMEPYAFMTYRTSPLKWQAWLAVSDGPKESDEEAAREFKTRVRRATEADHNATGASRVVGSINFKPDYAPDFPVVTLGYLRAGFTTTVAAIEKAGYLAPRERPIWKRAGLVARSSCSWMNSRNLKGCKLSRKPLPVLPVMASSCGLCCKT
jgi:hypothetical protein